MVPNRTTHHICNAYKTLAFQYNHYRSLTPGIRGISQLHFAIKRTLQLSIKYYILMLYEKEVDKFNINRVLSDIPSYTQTWQNFLEVFLGDMWCTGRLR